MKNYRRKRYERHIGYTPIHTKPTKRKPKKHSFASKSNSELINSKGIEMEQSSIKQKNILYFVGIVASVLLLFFDVKDEGMLFEGLGFKFSGSLVGTLLFGICAYCIYKNEPKVTIE